ncbi:hypothetical protein ACI3ET_10850 [Ornithinimicrobium sp. LYQ121]
MPSRGLQGHLQLPGAAAQHLGLDELVPTGPADVGDGQLAPQAGPANQGAGPGRPSSGRYEG